MKSFPTSSGTVGSNANRDRGAWERWTPSRLAVDHACLPRAGARGRADRGKPRGRRRGAHWRLAWSRPFRGRADARRLGRACRRARHRADRVGSPPRTRRVRSRFCSSARSSTPSSSAHRSTCYRTRFFFSRLFEPHGIQTFLPRRARRAGRARRRVGDRSCPALSSAASSGAGRARPARVRMSDTLVFVPAWNEEQNLPDVLDDLGRVLPERGRPRRRRRLDRSHRRRLARARGGGPLARTGTAGCPWESRRAIVGRSSTTSVLREGGRRRPASGGGAFAVTRPGARRQVQRRRRSHAYVCRRWVCAVPLPT